MPRLLPVDVNWTGELADKIASKIANIPPKRLDIWASIIATEILILVQEALDEQSIGIENGRKITWNENAYAILKQIQTNNGLTERSLNDINHMFKMIEREKSK